MKSVRAIRHLGLLAVVWFGATLTGAQTNLGAIQGSVTDRFGAVIPNARIKAVFKNTKRSEKDRNTVTDENGEFKFSELSFGRYELEVAVTWRLGTVRKSVEINPRDPVRTRIVFTIGGCTEGDAEYERYTLTEADRAEIVRRMLNLFLDKHSSIMMSGQPRSRFILSSQSIKSQWLDLAHKSKFTLMTPSEIQSHADKTKDFPFFSFGDFKVKGHCVEISFDNTWAIGKHSGMIYLSGGGVFYVFRKSNGVWEGEFDGEWVS